MYRGLLSDLSRHQLQLPDRDFDTGKMTSPTEYSLADATYAKLAVKLAAMDPASIDPKVRENVLAFYRNLDLPFDTKKHPDEWRKTVAAIDKLKQSAEQGAEKEVAAFARLAKRDRTTHILYAGRGRYDVEKQELPL